MEKNVETALANVDIVISNVQMKRQEHIQLINDMVLIKGQCEKAGTADTIVEPEKE